MELLPYIDYRIDEKIRPLFNDLSQIKAWQESIENRIIGIDDQVSELRKAFNILHEALLSKIREYNVKINEIETTSSAFSELFKKTSKLLAENLHKLEAVSLT